jgi:hypothetical protein
MEDAEARAQILEEGASASSLEQLLRLERYERRALSRRKRGQCGSLRSVEKVN